MIFLLRRGRQSCLSRLILHLQGNHISQVQLRNRRKDALLTNTDRPCLQQCVPISVRFLISCRRGGDADGGYLVPEEYDRRLIDVLEEENIMRGLATVITTSGEHKINIAASKPAAV